jgi:hypothetical protein
MNTEPVMQKPLLVLGSDTPTALERVAVDLLCREVRDKWRGDVVLLEPRSTMPAAGDILLLGVPGSNVALETLSRGLPSPLLLPIKDPSREGFTLYPYCEGNRRLLLALGASPQALIWAICDLLDSFESLGSVSLSLPRRSTAPHFTLRAFQSNVRRLSEENLAAKLADYKADIDYALRRRMNTVTLGLDWPDNLSSLVTYRYFPSLADTVNSGERDQRAQQIGELVDYVVQRGMALYLTLTELHYPPELVQRHPEVLAVAPPRGVNRWYRPPASGFTSLARPDKICPAHPLTRAFFKAKVKEITERFPSIAGLEIWVAHGACDIFYCDCPICHDQAPHERLARLCHDALEAMDEVAPQGRRVILRTYLGGWRQALAERFFKPLAGELSPRVILGTKAQYGDMYYGNAIHPLAGAFPGYDEMIEYCLGGEYRAGLRWGVTAPVADDYIARRAREHARRGCTGMSMRHLAWRSRLNEIDFLVFGALAWDPYASIEPIWERWARGRFGAVGPEMIELLRGATEVMSKTLYAHGVSLTHWAVFPENLQRLRHLTMDRSAQAVEDGFRRIAPTRTNLEYLMAEKDQAIRRAEQLLRNLEGIKEQLTVQDYEALRRGLIILRELGHLFRGLVNCFWRYLIWERTLSEVRREWQRDELLAALAEWREAISAARPVLAQVYGPELFEALGVRPTIYQEAIRPEGYYLEYLEQIANDIEGRINVEPASVWGYYPVLSE